MVVVKYLSEPEQTALCRHIRDPYQTPHFQPDHLQTLDHADSDPGSPGDTASSGVFSRDTGVCTTRTTPFQ